MLVHYPTDRIFKKLFSPNLSSPYLSYQVHLASHFGPTRHLIGVVSMVEDM
jgi:hypothetical protein